MIADIGIWRAAWLLVDRYGDAASSEASARAVKLIKVGDLDGAATWREISAAVYELRRQARYEDESIN